MDWLKDWWHVITGFALLLAGIVRLEVKQKAMEDAERDDPYMTKSLCNERQGSCKNSNMLQFASVSKELAEIKLMISTNYAEAQKNHNDLVKVIMENLRN